MPGPLHPRIWLLVLVLPALACAGAVPPPQVASPEAVSTPPPQAADGSPAPGFDLPESALGTQRLFRIRYQGERGEGRLRLVLRLVREDHYSISTSDPLGRALWSLSLVGEDLVLADHRAETFCRSRGEVTLPEVALSPLPLRTLPGVLLGYLPIQRAVELRWEGAESVEVVDGPDRRWSARLTGDAVEAWTLWLEEVPTLWWTRQSEGGILSHRRGVQFRWRQVVVEPLAGDPPALEAPAEYRETLCDESALQQLREDQPAPGGSGAAG